MIYPWLESTLDGWRRRLAAGRKPQALIIHGNEGLGKSAFIEVVVAELMCKQPQPEPCGHCQSCRLLTAGHHPDVIKLEPEKGLIKVKEIRRLVEFFVSTAHSGAHKVAVISQAEQMNKAAANALLKVLEEPPASGLLILQTAHIHHLLPTIRSRCLQLQITLSAIQKQQAMDWLTERNTLSSDELAWIMTLADGLPLTADDLLQHNKQSSFTEHLKQISDYLTNNQTVTVTANYLAKNLDQQQWQLLQRYFLAWVKQQWRTDDNLNLAQQPLTSWLMQHPCGTTVCLKMCDLINQIMVNFNSQVKTQLQIESMLVDLRAAS